MVEFETDRTEPGDELFRSCFLYHTSIRGVRELFSQSMENLFSGLVIARKGQVCDV